MQQQDWCSPAEAFLVVMRMLSAWSGWIHAWGGQVSPLDGVVGPDEDSLSYTMHGGVLAEQGFDCLFRIRPTGSFGVGCASFEMVVTDRLDVGTHTVHFAYDGTAWKKTGTAGLRGIHCTWSDRPEFPIETIGTWLNILAHQLFCRTCGALLVRGAQNGFVCSTPDAPQHHHSPTSV